LSATADPTPRLKIVLLTLTRGGVSGGYRKYLQRLLPLLREQPEIERVDHFAPPQLAAAGDLTWPQNDDLRGFPELRKSVAALRPDVVFIPTGRVMRVGELPVVSMIRNMEPLEVPFGGNSFVEGVKNVARARLARRSALRADRVIAVSGHVRDFIVSHWGVPESRVAVVYHGVDAADPAEPVRPPVLEAVGDAPFLFTAGSIRPARGLEDVVQALSSLPPDVKLVIAGTVDRGAEHYHRAMRELAQTRGVASRIVWAGQLDRQAMTWCFRKAAFFVMTSRAEACPNAALEAMAEGAVSISTDHPPMPEFFADAALYYRERDGDALARRLAEGFSLSDNTEWRQRARLRARAFTWDATARATVAELLRARDRRMNE
jgi:glycosyltransferase involved in cell wall biosynthesis